MDFLSSSHINTAIAGVVVLFLVIIFYSKSWRSRNRKDPPQPPEIGGAWPIIGHLLLLRKAELTFKFLASLADEYGPIYTLRLGVHKNVVVTSSELAKEIFTKHDIAVSSRPEFLAGEHLGCNYAMFGFAPYNPYWREIRKIIAIELLSARRLEQLKHIRISETETAIRQLYKKWNNHHCISHNKPPLSESSGGVLVDMKKWLGDFALNIVLRMIVGKRYYGEDVDNDEEARICKKMMMDFSQLMGTFVVGDVVPWLRWLDIGGHEKRMKRFTQDLESVTQNWLQQHRQRKVNGDVSSGDEQDFMDVMLSIVDHANIRDFDADTVIKCTCMTLILGGGDPPAAALVWVVALLLNHRQALKKVQEELDKHVGKDRKVDEGDISKLHYLQAAVKESFRLYPASPFSGRRKVTEDIIVGGYKIKKGAWLSMHIWKIGRDPNVWPDPTEFKPERFLDAHKDFDFKGQHFEMLPFGGGRRICPGITFSLQEMLLVLANLFHSFDLSTPNNEPVDMSETGALVNIKPTPLDLLITPRLPSSLY